MSEPVLDVRAIPPHERHARIFDLFDGLGVGAAFILANDHDPRPLYHQMNSLRPEEFRWDYLESGPEMWRIRITRSAQAPSERGASCCGTCG